MCMQSYKRNKTANFDKQKETKTQKTQKIIHNK